MSQHNIEQDLKSFTLLVKPKIESIIYSCWVLRTNRKGKRSQYFFVATDACFYLCKESMFSKSLNIDKQFPWVKITAFLPISPTSLTFEFYPDKISIETEEANKICRKLRRFFRDFFPDEFQVRIDSTLTPLMRQHEKSTSLYFPSMYVSYCYALKVPVVESFLHDLRKSLKDNPECIDFSRISPDKRSIRPLICSLQLSRSITDLRVNESKSYGIIQTVTEVLQANGSFTSLTLGPAKKYDRLQPALDILKSTEVVSLSFNRFIFASNDLGVVLTHQYMPTLKHLSFSECGIGTQFLSFISSNGNLFTSLDSIGVTMDHNAIPTAIIPQFLSFASNQHISSIDFTSTELDIHDFFSAVCKANLFITKATLDGNFFSEKCSFPYRLPEQLTRIELRSVRWTAPQLLQFLTKQTFQKNSSIDLSNAVIVGNNWEGFFSQIESASPGGRRTISEIQWNFNPLDKRLFKFLSSMESLVSVDFSNCTYSDVPIILNALLLFIQTRTIKSFSMRGSKASTNGPILRELIPVMQADSSLEKLDISNNQMGNVGYEVLTRFVERSTSIKSIKLDGIFPTKAHPIIDFFRVVATSPSITDIGYPKQDVNKVIAKHAGKKERIQTAWADVKMRINSNTHKLDEVGENANEGVLVSQLTSSFTVTSSFNNSENQQDIFTDVTWDVTINLPFYSGFSEWEAMKQKYTLQKISGISVS